jgi:hypothetical protein
VIQFATHTPKEAAALSGVTSDVQREWRRRGLMPFLTPEKETAGWTAFDLKEVSALTIMRALSDGCQLPLTTARIVAEASADHVVAFILEKLDDRQRKALKTSPLAKSPESERFVVVGSDKIPQFSGNWEELLLRQPSPATTSLDLKKIADLIVSRAKKSFVVGA